MLFITNYDNDIKKKENVQYKNDGSHQFLQTADGYA